MILSVDMDYGSPSYAILAEDSMTHAKSHDIFAETTEDIEGVVHFNEKMYFTGEDALLEDSESVISLLTKDHLKDYAPLFLWSILKKNNLSCSDIDTLYISISPCDMDIYEKLRVSLENFTINGENFHFPELYFTAQGSIAKNAINELISPPVDMALIINIGDINLSIFEVYKGKSFPVVNDSVMLEGFESEGIIKILQSLQEYVRKEYDTSITNAEAIRVLYSGNFELFGKHDLSKIINSYSQDYSRYVGKICNRFKGTELKRIKDIFIVGSHSKYVDAEAFLSSFKVRTAKVRTLKGATFFNATGGIIFHKNNQGD